MNFPHGVTVTVRSVTTTDDGMGNATDETVEYEWGPCAVAPRYATESTDPRVPPVIVGKTVMGPPTMTRIDTSEVVAAVIDSDDTLVIEGDDYETDGEAGDWKSPFTGWHPGLEVAVKRWGTA